MGTKSYVTEPVSAAPLDWIVPGIGPERKSWPDKFPIPLKAARVAGSLSPNAKDKAIVPGLENICVSKRSAKLNSATNEPAPLLVHVADPVRKPVTSMSVPSAGLNCATRVVKKLLGSKALSGSVTVNGTVMVFALTAADANTSGVRAAANNADLIVRVSS